MIVELTDLIQQWQHTGESVVLFIDSHENLNKIVEVQRLLIGEKCSMIYPTRARLPNQAPHPTYHRNQGYPIDRIV